MQFITANEKLYVVKRTYKPDGNFSKMVQNTTIEQILSVYKADKLLKDTNGNYHLVNEVTDVEPIETE
jgi:hypothetical protein